MKKTLLSALLTGTMALSLSAIIAAPAMANCPAKGPCGCRTRPPRRT